MDNFLNHYRKILSTAISSLRKFKYRNIQVVVAVQDALLETRVSRFTDLNAGLVYAKKLLTEHAAWHGNNVDFEQHSAGVSRVYQCNQSCFFAMITTFGDTTLTDKSLWEGAGL